MKYSVPQFIDVEDKVIGPLTVKQFGYIIFALILLALLWAIVGISILFFVFGLPILLFFAALAFLKINGRPFQYFVLSLVGYVTKGTRIWVWRRTVSSSLIKVKSEQKKEEVPQEARVFSKTNIQKLSQVLDTGTSTRASVDLETLRVAERVRGKQSRVIE